MKKAIILGATGLTGGILLRKLLNDNSYGKIILFSRSPVKISHPKIEEHLINMFELDKHTNTFKADQVYCCIGTTKNKTPDEETYRRIDHGIPVAAAKLSKNNGILTFLVISALGADAKSSMFYNKTKGEMEHDVLAQKIRNTYIFQPSLITGEREEKRALENLAKHVMKVIDHVLVGPLKKYRSIHPEAIAKAMIYVANNGYSAQRIESKEIKEIAGAAG